MSRVHPAAVGFTFSPLVAALPIPAIHDGSFGHYFELDVWMVVLPSAYGAALLLATPAYFLLRHRIPYTPVNLALVGAVVACLPLALILPFGIESSVFFGLFAFSGAVGGCTFWLITKRRHDLGAAA